MVLASLVGVLLTPIVGAQGGEPAYKPERINARTMTAVRASLLPPWRAFRRFLTRFEEGDVLNVARGGSTSPRDLFET